MYPKKGEQVYIQAYKHDGSLHRTWCMADVIEADEEHFIVVTNKTWVIEDNGKRWYTKEPAIGYFYTHRWFNVIAMMREKSVYYYCNLASPALYDGEAIKYIDYDIDYKIYENEVVITMDLDEYEVNKKIMHYPIEIENIIDNERKRLLQEINEHVKPFNYEYAEQLFQDYLQQLTFKE